MKVFNARHFLRHISMPTLRQFTDGHVLGARLNLDWSSPADSLPAGVGDSVQDLETRLLVQSLIPLNARLLNMTCVCGWTTCGALT